MTKDKKILVIPRRLVFVKFLEVPALPHPEIKKMVQAEAVKYISYPKEEMNIGYRDLGSYKDGFSSLMLVVGNKHIIQEAMRKKEALGFHIDAIRLHTELLYLFLLKKELVSKDRLMLVIHIGKKDSEIMIIDNLRPIFSKGFKNSESFLEEMERSVLAYEKDRYGPDIDDILVIYSSEINIEEARPHLERNFTIPVSFYEYSEDLNAIDLPVKIDLYSREIRRSKPDSRKKQVNMVTCFLIVFILILIFMYISFKAHEKKGPLDMSLSILDRIHG
ncbi:MAG: hypothetical protein V3S13_03465 [Candidatus Omnitrophota bacterium]